MLRPSLLLFLLLFVCCAASYSQLPASLGRGTLHVSRYFVAKGQSVSPGDAPFDKMVYWVNGDKILRKYSASRSFVSSSKDSNNIRMSLDMAHLTYLIDWDDSCAYISVKQKGKWEYSRNTLKNFDYEFLYRFPRVINKRSKVLYTGTDRKMIAGYPAYAGYASFEDSINGHRFNCKIKFYYTKKVLPVYSPLNFHLVDFPYNVLSISLPFTDGSDYSCEIVITDVNNTLPNESFVMPKPQEVKRTNVTQGNH